jgi:LCP family protein required for cell wall assembly
LPIGVAHTASGTQESLRTDYGLPSTTAGTLLRRMAPEEKPYRVYRGGRVKGKVPAIPTRPRPEPRWRLRTDSIQRPTLPRRRRFAFPKQWPWRRIVALGLLILFVVVVAWAITGYFAFASGVSSANKRLDHAARTALVPGSGLLLSHSTTILLLGTDSSTVAGRQGDHHADSIMIVRTDPSHHKLSYLSIPRDLQVPIPGVGNAKINAAFQAGGATLAIKTVRQFTGIAINHVVVVDFNSFKDLIDAEGGITVNVPKPILSNRFDCPYSSQQRCERWPGWRFAKGKQHMNGERALIYARIRENRLDPRESDLTRGARQQAVTQAATGKLTSFATLVGLPFDGGKLMRPLATDLSTWQLIQLGWVKFRASGGHSLYCRLGGDISSASGQSVIIPSEDNRNVLSEWAGRSAPQPPTTTFGPGCRVGHPLQ